MDVETRIGRTTIHEASHAIVAHATGQPVRQVLVQAAAPGEGQVDYHPDLDSRTPYELMRTLAAGVLGEVLAGIDADWAERHADSDLEKIIALMRLETISRLPKHRKATTREAQAAARKSLRSMQRAFASAELLLRAQWGAVEAVAAWLIRADGFLPGGHLAHVIENAPDDVRLTPTTERLAALLRDSEGDPIVAKGVREAAAGPDGRRLH